MNTLRKTINKGVALNSNGRPREALLGNLIDRSQVVGGLSVDIFMNSFLLLY